MKNIDEQKVVEEIDQYKSISETIGCILISVFASLLDIPIGITSSL